MDAGYTKVLAEFNSEGDATDRSDQLPSLPALNELSATTTDYGKLLYTSALVLKAQEDKSNAGALIASLSNPWGDITSAEKPSTD